LAKDPRSSATWLLKPNDLNMGPSAGITDEKASPAQREVAFYHMAKVWGLDEYMPESQLIIADGMQYAAIHLLPWTYETLDSIKKEDPVRIKTVLDEYLKLGILHRWAVLDAVLSNVDRHSNNMMLHDKDLKLIDHGSSMAGEGFDVKDRYTFVPYYLRYAFTGRFSALSPIERLKVMPRVSSQVEESIRNWIVSLNPSDLDKVLPNYGINTTPAKERLIHIQQLIRNEPSDLGINRFWSDV
jgi:hypothetical protein